MLKIKLGLMICFLLAACAGADDKEAPTVHGNPTIGIGMPSDKLMVLPKSVARDLIGTLGQQQTFAMLGWQQNPDYKPMQHCFDYWRGTSVAALQEGQIKNCELHAKDLSQLYASYGVDAKPVLFKSDYYWDQKSEFDTAFPELVKAWKAAGGSEDDASYLKHPICAKPLQKGWTGSDFFYDGRESPICRAHKVEALEAMESKQD